MDFVYVIYNRKTGSVLGKFDNELECIKVYNEIFKKETTNWIAIDLKFVINYILYMEEKGE